MSTPRIEKDDIVLSPKTGEPSLDFAFVRQCLVRESVSAVVAAQPFLNFRTDCSTRERVAVARGR